jgi:L-serine dehydratase
MSAISIFNDVIGPVMRGPSSSHCAAALRIGRLARDLMAGEITEVLVEFDREGSLPTTHESQGSDMGLFGGLLGWDADDERLPGSPRALADAGIALRIETVDVGDPHPNTYRLTLRNAREAHALIAISTGGGMMEVRSIDGVALRVDGGYAETLIWLDGAPRDAVARLQARVGADEVLIHEVDGGLLVQVKAAAFVPDDALSELRPTRVRRLGRVLPVPSSKDVRLPFTGSAELLAFDGDRDTPLWRLAVAYEMARSGFGEDEVVAQMVGIVRILRRSIDQGITGTQYDDRVLGHQSVRFL